MWGRAVLVVLALTLPLHSCGGNSSETSDQDQLQAGRAINIFSRFGYLSISMRVVPRNDSDRSWIFREPTIDIFSNIQPHIKHQTRRLPILGKKPAVLNGDFHMEFCDNLRQLLQAYFRDFTIEKLDRPWTAFTGSWLPEVVAKHMGINSSFVQGDHCYVLVRLSRFRDIVKLDRLPEDLRLVDTVASEIDQIDLQNVTSVLQFIKKFGSHYISSYVTGNSLYQVFVYRRSVYTRIKERLKSHGIGKIPNSELVNYFSPWFAEHMGHIRVASGNQTVEEWANSFLRINYYIFTYASLIKLHTDTSLLRTLNDVLRNEAVLQLNLRTLAPAFKNLSKRLWFEEVLDNYIKLWDVNM